MRRFVTMCILFGSISVVSCFGGCVKCGPHHECVAGFAYSCEIDETSCISCGFCNGVPCDLPIQPAGPDSTNHVWIKSGDAYLGQVEKSSIALATVTRKLMQRVRQGKCVQHGSGYVTVAGGAEVEFQAYATPGSQVIYLKHWHGPDRLLLTDAGWQITQSRPLWFSKSVARGSY